MGDILKKIQELLDEGNNFTERRGSYPKQLPNWFDAIDGCEASGVDPSSTNTTGNGTKGKPKKMPDISDIP